jgi:hypothetical protein
MADTVQVITLAVRTPLTKARKGGLSQTPLDELLIALLRVLTHPRLHIYRIWLKSPTDRTRKVKS